VGANIDVDALGNIRIKRDGAWEDFFPFCIMGDYNRPNYYQYYSDLGFNCDARGGQASNLTVAKNAVSQYNPKGIMMVTDLSSHLYQCDGCWGWDAGHAQLTNYITQLKNSPASDRMLWWYDDNEIVFYAWQQKMDSMAVVHAQDRTVVNTGQRRTPMFMLQGAYNMTRSYRRASDGWIAPEVAGTYSDQTSSGGWDVIMNQQNQVIPASIVNANIVSAYSEPGKLRGLLYKFLGRGVRAWTMWKDCYIQNCGGAADPLERVPWLPDVPYLRKELDAMLPLIRQPHWTTWSVTHNGGSNIHVGTRNYQNQGHLLVVNDTGTSKTITFTIGGLSYTPQTVVNFFTGATVATVTGNSFTVTLPALTINSGTAVYRITGQSSVLLPGPTGGKLRY
jgi:hypothetical protein